MARKPAKAYVVQGVPPPPTERIIATAERLVMMLFQRDREILERRMKLQERALDLIQHESLQKPGNDQLAELLQSVVSKVSVTIDKVIDLKKLQAMSMETKAAVKTVKTRAAGAKPA